MNKLSSSSWLKKMALSEEPHSPSFLCEEHDTLEEHSGANSFQGESESDNDQLLSLISKERATRDTLLQGPRPRYDVVRWISKACAFYGFTALTAVLAVNYFDRFITSLRFQRDKPWMTQLTAVACLSLAAKMEETQVPLLLDLQLQVELEEPKFVFEAKTVQRMELLVLSTLKWRMNPVTPISFFDHMVTRLGLKSPLHWEFLWRCQRVLLCVIADSRVVSLLPSTLAAAAMIHVIKEIEPFHAKEYRNQLLGILKISEEQVNECYELILELLLCYEGIHNLSQKRKHLSEPKSPGGFIDASFSCDSSNDSWTVASSVSLEPVFKRRKAQDQHMRLPSVNRVSNVYRCSK